jgi:hypothetical protein
MKLETIMRKIQEADIGLTLVVPEESYDFAVDINNALEKMGKYSVMYYERCEEQGLTYKEATNQLGEYLRSNLDITVTKTESSN